ncbi:helix-turn-helix domain-containing protein [Eubacteriales bacterium OttesenSCG-928-G02]|nr:helix-turn-helix domain-containing protein [Eubacteriales bacterium OttesenSCG-928-G02]
MIAKAINEYINDNKIKKSFICKKTGLTRYSLVCALKGKRNFSVDEYILICRALNVTYDFFFNIKKLSS